jgi:secreted PhoX family phosphatase
MAAFPGPGDTTILVRNHELEPNEDPPVVGRNLYRSSQMGGTTGIVVGSDRIKIEDYVTSSGTQRNCAGGATPWGTWLTCEEIRTTDHGYVFEVMPDDPENDLSKTPIRAMGSFRHEAAGVDPATGIVYLTEDDSRLSFLYRYVPDDPSPVPGALHKGGKLQVMTLEQGTLTPILPTPGRSSVSSGGTSTRRSRTRQPRSWARPASSGWRAPTSPAGPSGSTTPKAARSGSVRSSVTYRTPTPSSSSTRGPSPRRCTNRTTSL